MAFAFVPPPVLELGNTADFAFFLQDQAGLGHDALVETRNQFLQAANQSPLLQNVRHNGQSDAPQFSIDVDVDKARWAWPSPTAIRHRRPLGPGSTSTTSSIAAASSACTCRLCAAVCGR